MGVPLANVRLRPKATSCNETETNPIPILAGRLYFFEPGLPRRACPGAGAFVGRTTGDDGPTFVTGAQ